MPFLMLFLLTLLTSACSTFTPANSPRTESATYNPKQDKMASLSTFDAQTEEEDEDDSELADTDRVEGTPEDLGDVEASQNRKAEEVTADALSRKSFPLVYNEFVEQWIKYFTGRGRNVFERWAQRSTRFIPVMKKVLRDDGLPEDLIFQAMIESGFNLKAASKAKAVGPWQFIKGTGTRYGMDVTYWVDERRDFIKSTHAASKYLKELHQIFGSWYLAAAAYNAGEGKVMNAVRRDRSRNFWELCRTKKNFRAETRNYVPKIIAAALVAKNPEKYGFDKLVYEEPLVWETIKVPGGVDLRNVSELAQIDYEYLMVLNAELRRGVTPPSSEEYELRVPPMKKEIIAARMNELKSKKYTRNFAIHVVRRGDTLGSIARRYGSDTQSIVELNQIKKTNRLRMGSELSIPIGDRVSRKKHKDRSEPVKKLSKAPTPASGNNSSSQNPSLRALAEAQSQTVASNGVYKVQQGDTLWEIAKKLNVPVLSLKKVNGLGSGRKLKIGQALVVPSL